MVAVLALVLEDKQRITALVTIAKSPSARWNVVRLNRAAGGAFEISSKMHRFFLRLDFVCFTVTLSRLEEATTKTRYSDTTEPEPCIFFVNYYFKHLAVQGGGWRTNIILPTIFENVLNA